MIAARCRSPRHCRHSAGFSYMEVLVAMTLIAVVLLPAIDALHTGVQAGDIHARQAVDRFRLGGRMEDVLARPYAELEAAADAAGGPAIIVNAYSDPPGTAARRLVYLARYDGDNADGDDNPFTGSDDGLLWVRVAIAESPDAIESLVAR